MQQSPNKSFMEEANKELGDMRRYLPPPWRRGKGITPNKGTGL